MVDEQVDERTGEDPTLHERATRITGVDEHVMALEAALTILSDSRTEPAVRRAVLARSDLPHSAALAALSDPDDSLRAFAVGLSALSADNVRSAEHDHTWLVRAELARRMDCPLDVLERLSFDPDAIVRRSALAHIGIGSDILLRILLSGKSRLDAEIAAGHPSLRISEHVADLMEVNSFGVMALLNRSDLPPELAAQWAVSDHPVNVRVSAVKHLSCPATTIGIALRQDASRDVRQAAAARTTCPVEDLLRATQDSSAEVRRAVAANPATPAAGMQALLVDHDDIVRRDAARSPHADPKILADLVARDLDLRVRKAALGNAHCPSRTVDEACRDEELVFTAAGNSSCTREGWMAALLTIRVMPRQAGTGEADPEQRQRDRVRHTAKMATKRLAAEDWSWLAGHPIERLNPIDLEVLLEKNLFEAAGDARELLRMAVARHRKADVTVLMALSGDPSEAVRKAVSARILDAVDGSL